MKKKHNCVNISLEAENIVQTLCIQEKPSEFSSLAKDVHIKILSRLFCVVYQLLLRFLLSLPHGKKDLKLSSALISNTF